MARVQGLDLMRFIAIMLVVALHAEEAIPLSDGLMGSLFRVGWVGVDCFFVLSGYLIGSQVFKQGYCKDQKVVTQIKTFWMRRWWRTLPLYFVVLSFYALVKPAFGYPFKELNWKFLLFFQNYTHFYDFVQSWSLCIEEHFYFIFPLFFYLFRFDRKPPIIWLGFVVLSVFSRFLIWSKGGVPHTAPGIDFSIRFVTHYHLDGIAMGVFLASTRNSWMKFNRPLRLFGGGLGLLLVFYPSMTLPYYLPGASLIWLLTSVALGFSLILVAIHDLQMPRWFYIPIHKVALWSYGIYLWNSFMIRVFHHLNLNINKNLEVLLFFLASILVAVPTYYLVEKPFLRFRDRFIIQPKKV